RRVLSVRAVVTVVIAADEGDPHLARGGVMARGLPFVPAGLVLVGENRWRSGGGLCAVRWGERWRECDARSGDLRLRNGLIMCSSDGRVLREGDPSGHAHKIGRASGRERGEDTAVARSRKE